MSKRWCVLVLLASLLLSLACVCLPGPDEPDGPAAVVTDDRPLSTDPVSLPTATSDGLPEDLDALDRALFANLQGIYQVFAASSGDVWDGLYRIDQEPLLFVRVDRSGQPQYGYLLSTSTPPGDGVALSPNPGGLPPVYRVTEGLDGFTDPYLYYDFAYRLGDLEMLAMRYREGDDGEDPRDPEWQPYVVHEGFHRFQDLNWEEPAVWDQEVDYPMVPENLALALLEHRILLARAGGARRSGSRLFAPVPRRASRADGPLDRS